MRTVTRSYWVAAALGFVVLLGSVRVGSAQVVSACYHKKKGTLRVLVSGQCKGKEQAIQWNAQGPQGAKGDTGDPGDPGPPGAAVYQFSGIMQDLPILSLTGWRQCYTDLYNNSSTPLASILAACPGPNLLLGCRLTGAGTLLLAANAPRADVLFDTGTGNTLHVANGVGWYFNGNWSWGFAPASETVQRGECDVVTNSNADKRLCWHTNNTPNINFGYRCGNNDLNASTAYERVIFEAP